MFGLFNRGGGAADTLTCAEVRQLMDKGEITLVDVREANEWANGRIPGAIHMPLSRLGGSLAQIPTDKPIVLYCLAGGRSAQALAMARGAGLEGLRHMGGGIQDWARNGFPIVR